MFEVWWQELDNQATGYLGVRHEILLNNLQPSKDLQIKDCEGEVSGLFRPKPFVFLFQFNRHMCSLSAAAFRRAIC